MEINQVVEPAEVVDEDEPVARRRAAVVLPRAVQRRAEVEEGTPLRHRARHDLSSLGQAAPHAANPGAAATAAFARPLAIRRRGWPLVRAGDDVGGAVGGGELVGGPHDSDEELGPEAIRVGPIRRGELVVVAVQHLSRRLVRLVGLAGHLNDPGRDAELELFGVRREHLVDDLHRQLVRREPLGHLALAQHHRRVPLGVLSRPRAARAREDVAGRIHFLSQLGGGCRVRETRHDAVALSEHRRDDRIRARRRRERHRLWVLGRRRRRPRRIDPRNRPSGRHVHLGQRLSSAVEMLHGSLRE
mmetsp:Transcript_33199/g.106540  ORF Transcript_33199/g.106540 Transcript_33199/m.106540 type:complete len:302 (-) Transcript_33199:1350-2255(-)